MIRRLGSEIRLTASIAAAVLTMATIASARAEAPLVAGPGARPIPAPHLDVPYVATPARVVDQMLSLAGVGSADYVLDLGSGDGRIVIAAALKHGARGMGVEIDPRLVKISNEKAQREGVGDRVKFVVQDLFKTDFAEASVITMYLLPNVNLKLRPKLLKLKPGTRIVSHDWDMGDWEPDRRVVLDVPEKKRARPRRWASVASRDQAPRESTLMLWKIPARIGGTWRAGDSLTITLEQKYQKLTGSAIYRGEVFDHTTGTVDGTKLRLCFAYRSDGSCRRGVSGELTNGQLRLVDDGSERRQISMVARRERQSPSMRSPTMTGPK